MSFSVASLDLRYKPREIWIIAIEGPKHPVSSNRQIMSIQHSDAYSTVFPLKQHNNVIKELDSFGWPFMSLTIIFFCRRRKYEYILHRLSRGLKIDGSVLSSESSIFIRFFIFNTLSFRTHSFECVPLHTLAPEFCR